MFPIHNGRIILMISIISLFTLFYCKDFAEILEVNECPLCFGKSFCSDFETGQLSIWNSDILFKTAVYIKYIFGITFIVFCSWNNKEVVIKQFDNSRELKDFSTSHINNGDRSGISIIEDLKLFLNIPFNSTLSPNLRLCPTTEKFETLLEHIDSLRNDSGIDSLINIWWMIHINPEPFVQQVLKAEQGWPVPKYYGSCGRAVVSEYCGRMLTACLNHDWNIRKHLAYQLLESAFNFTFNHPHFAFYFTDITPDNIAVRASGLVRFIDLDNVIIVEKNTTANLTSWTVPHLSEDIECDNCFAFSSDHICSHQYSDHNVYAVCREILNPESHLIDGGLLHSMPPAFSEKHLDFHDILKQCIRPRTLDRFHFAKKLMKILS